MDLTLHSPLTALPGVGQARAKALAKLGLSAVGDLLAYFPREYEDRTLRESIAALPLEEPVCFAAVVAVMAIVFACFTGAAYMMETIASWNTPMVPVAVLGFSLLGGICLGVLVLALSGALEDAAKGGFKMAALAVLIVGLVLGVAGLLVQVMSVSGMGNALVDGADLVAAASAPMWIGVVCMVVAAAAAFMALRNTKSTALAAAAPVLAVVGVFAARLAFYAVQLSVGLYIG